MSAITPDPAMTSGPAAAGSPVYPSGQQVTLRAGELTAVVVEVGGGLRELRAGDRPVLDGYPAEEMAGSARGATLLPWPNRVADGRYRFEGRDLQLALTEPDRHNAIHGLTRWANWTIETVEPAHAVFGYRLHPQPGYPFVLDCSIDYSVDEADGLTVRTTVTNGGDAPAPYGVGAHPYLTVGTDVINPCTVTVPGSVYLPTDDHGIPTGRADVEGTPYDLRAGRVLGDTAIDNAYTGLDRDDDGMARVVLTAPDHSASATLWVDDAYPWLEIFTGDGVAAQRRRQGLGVEPMTCPPNAFVTGEDLVVLEPGQSWAGSWGITTS